MDDSQAEQWDRYAGASPDATGYHQWAWLRILSRTMKLRVYALGAWRDGTLVGILPLARQHLWPLRPALISLPFVNHGGVLADDDEAEAALLDEARRIAGSLGVTRVELRHHTARAGSWPRRDDKVRFLLDLSAGAASVWQSLPGPRRTQTRRASRDGLRAQVGGAELLDDFYRLIAREWHEHGTPVLPRRFFEAVLESFPAESRICVVRSGDRTAGAGFLYRFGQHVENPWLGARPEYATSQATTLLCWSMIEESCRWQAMTFDFGRSSRGSGPYVYKQRWGASEDPLPWSVWPDTAVSALDTTQSAKLVKSAWRRLPRPIANRLGPVLARHLPL